MTEQNMNMVNLLNSICIEEPKCVSMGYNSKTTADNSTAVGYYAASTAKNSVTLGSNVSAIHENSVVIGTNITSHTPNSILFNQAEITETEIKHNGGTTIISGQDVTQNTLCSTCNNNIIHGVTWIRNGYVTNDNIKYNDVRLGLCFNCILDCVMEFKAKQSWPLHVK